MLIDCDTCQVKGPACGDCVVTFVLGPPNTSGVHLDSDEQAAIAVLAGSGLIPPLRLVSSSTMPEQECLLDDSPQLPRGRAGVRPSGSRNRDAQVKRQASG